MIDVVLREALNNKQSSRGIVRKLSIYRVKQGLLKRKMIYLATKVKGMEVVLATLATSMPRVDSQNLGASIAAESIIIGIYVKVKRCNVSVWSKQH